MGGAKVLVLARLDDPVIADVRSVLNDWAAVGLVDQPLWVDVEQGRLGQLHGWGAGASGQMLVPVDNWLAEQGVKGSGVGVRIVTLQPLRTASGAVLAETVTELCSRLSLPSISILNILAPAPDVIGLPDGVVFDNHRNVLLQPIASESPDGTAVLVKPGRDYSVHVAAGLVTLGGLWSMIDGAPNDADPVVPGKLVQTARTYLRYLDGSEILSGLAFSVLQDGGALPSSRNPQGQRFPTVSQNVVGAVRQAAFDLVRRHPVAGYQRKPPPVVPQKKRITAMTAIRDFLSFMGTAMMRAPGDWVRRKVDDVTRRIGSSLTSALYGKDGAYEVVMGRAPGRSPDADAARDGALQLMRMLNAGSEPPAANAEQLWMEEMGVAAELVDGGMSNKVALPLKGDQRLIVSDPRLIAPLFGDKPFVVPAGILTSQIPVTISADDPFTAYQVLDELESRRQSDASWQGPGGQAQDVAGFGGPPTSLLGSGNALVAAETADALQSWLSQRQNFAWAVSETIGGHLHDAQLDQSEMLTVAGDEAIQAARRAAEQEAKKTRGRLLGWMLVLVVAVVAVVLLVLFAVFARTILIVIAVALALGWLVGAMATFVGSSRKYYQLMHALDVLSAKREWADKLRFEIPADIVRLSDVYSRSRQWSRVVGDLVDDPFCLSSFPNIGQGAIGRIAGLLPQGLAFGRLPFDAKDYRAEMNEAARLALQPGWLEEAESERRSLALRPLLEQYGTRVDDQVWASDGDERESPLQMLITAARAPEFRRQRALQALDWFTSKIQEGATPLKNAEIEAGGNPRSVDAATFMQALIDAEPAPQPVGVASRGLQAGVTTTKFTHLWGNSPTTAAVMDGGVSSARTVINHATAQRGGIHLLDRLIIRCDLSEQSWPGNYLYFADSTWQDPADQYAVGMDDEYQPPLPEG